MSRERLPNRRPSDLLNFEHNGIAYTASVSVYADGRIGEVFVGARKVNSNADYSASAAAIAASLALQRGCTVDELRAALPRLEDGSPAEPLAHVLDVFREGAA